MLHARRGSSPAWRMGGLGRGGGAKAYDKFASCCDDRTDVLHCIRGFGASVIRYCCYLCTMDCSGEEDQVMFYTAYMLADSVSDGRISGAVVKRLVRCSCLKVEDEKQL